MVDPPHNWVGFHHGHPPFFSWPWGFNKSRQAGEFQQHIRDFLIQLKAVKGPVLFGVNPDVMKILEKDGFLVMRMESENIPNPQKNGLFLYWMWVHWSPRVDVESFCSFNWVSYDSYAQLVNRISSKTTGLYEARHHSRGFNGWLKG